MKNKPKAVILITTDEQRRDTLGIYGCEAIETPHIDSIGRAGSCFDNAFTNSPWCMPSRCSLLTGCYPHRHGAYSNFSGGPLNPEIPNLYTVAKSQGYGTAHIGKCHYERVRYGTFSPDKTAENPATREYYLSLGIDHLALQDDKNVSIWQYDDYSRDLDREGHLSAYRKEAWNRKEGGVFAFPGPPDWHPDAWVGRQAAEYLDRWDGEDSLFLWVSFSGPHYPVDPPEEYLKRVDSERLPPIVRRDGEWGDNGKIHYHSYHGPGRIDGCGYLESRACSEYDNEYWDRMRQHYMANVALIDDQVGRVLDSVKRRFGDDTLIVFTSDHGDMLGNHGLWGKHNCGYDEVLKVPFLVKMPGERPVGDRIEERIQMIDLFPTIAKSIGANPGSIDGAPIDDVVSRGGHEYTLAEGEGFYCLSDGRYKLVRARDGEQSDPIYEFFDLQNDPDCFENLYSDPRYSKLVEKFRNQVESRPEIAVIL